MFADTSAIQPSTPPPYVDVLFLITDLDIGGAENQVRDLALRLSSRGLDIAVVSMMPPAISVDAFEAAGICVEHLGLARGSKNLWAIARLRSVIRRYRPRIIHSQMVHANLLARITKPLSGMPLLISTAQNVHEGGPLRTWALRATDPLSNRTTHVSRAGMARYIEKRVVRRNRAVWIPNGVDLQRFAPTSARREAIRAELEIGPDEFLWLTIGSLTPQKAHDRLLRAFAQLPGSSILAIAGSGPGESKLRKASANLGLEGKWRLLGSRSDPEALLSAADAFVLSSSWEGLPLVLLEASAAGLPIVCTDVGGCREVVRDGVTGIVVESLQAESLADAMRSLMSRSPDDRRAMGEAGRALVTKTFDIEGVVDQWQRLYDSLASLDPTRPSAT